MAHIVAQLYIIGYILSHAGTRAHNKPGKHCGKAIFPRNMSKFRSAASNTCGKLATILLFLTLLGMLDIYER